MEIKVAALGTTLSLARPASRIVSLVSGSTEALFAMGAGNLVVGVTPWCANFVPGLAAPVVADYVSGDPAAIAAVKPDLVLATDGVQLPLARRLAAAGLPVVVLPVPRTRAGILENAAMVGALCGRLREARALCEGLEAGFAALAASAPAPRPRAYCELWFGRHVRRPGGLSFVHDLLWLAGLDPVHGDRPDGYELPDLEEVRRLAPEWVVVYSEPEHPIDARALLAERGWDAAFAPRLAVATIARGRNLIHDGPSFLETARWLRGEITAREDGPRRGPAAGT
jgi:ABC-type Fe3+-hydroxamate transport system substrate-binding protein